MSLISIREYRANPFGAVPGQLAAVKVGRYKGRNVYRVPVFIRANNARLCGTVASGWTTVTARGAAEAAQWVADNLDRPETEVIAVGPKGGEVHKYVSWERVIGREVFGSGLNQSQQELFA